MQHGQFTAEDTEITALVLRVFLIGLGFAAVDQMLVFASYARKDTWRPALAGMISIVIYTIVAVLLLPPLGLLSLMVADAVKHIVHTSIMLIFLQRHVGGLAGYHISATVVKSIVAAICTGLAAALSAGLLRQMMPLDSFLQRLIVVAVSGSVGLAAYLGAAYLLDLQDAMSLWNLVWSRVRS